MTTSILRPYQDESIANVSDLFDRGMISPLICLPTGSGKTKLAVELHRQLFHPKFKHRVIFVAPARALINQTYNAYLEQWPDAGYWGIGKVMGQQNVSDAAIMIGSLATLIDRQVVDFDPITAKDIIVDRDGNIRKAPGSKRSILISRRFDNILSHGGMPELVFFDEAHTSALTDGGLILIQRLREITDALSVAPVKILGATATPFRADNRSFSQVFDSIAINRTVRFMQQHGFLVPLTEAKFLTIGTDEAYTQDVLMVENWAEFMVKGWKEHGQGRPTIAFTGRLSGEVGGVEAAELLAAEFNKQGIPSFTVNGQYSVDADGERRNADYREVLYNAFRKGQRTVYTAHNVGLFGLDLPNASCLIWARGAEDGGQSPVIFPQALGRVLRLSPGTGKEDSILLDYTGNPLLIQEHIDLLGMVVDPLEKHKAVPLDEDKEDPRQFDGVDSVTAERIVALTNNMLAITIQVVRGGDNDWYINTLDNTLSISVSTKDTLLILPPNFPKKKNPEKLMALVQEEWERPGSSGMTSLEGLSKNEYGKLVQFCQWLIHFYDNWTLWHTHDGELAKRTWIANDEELGELQSKAATYTIERIPNRIELFSNKRVTWKRQPPSDAQMNKLKQLMSSKDWEYFISRPESERRKGAVSKMISHLLGYRSINKLLTQIDSILEVHNGNNPE